jgi:hypothetical protein
MNLKFIFKEIKLKSIDLQWNTLGCNLATHGTIWHHMAPMAVVKKIFFKKLKSPFSAFKLTFRSIKAVTLCFEQF